MFHPLVGERLADQDLLGERIAVIGVEKTACGDARRSDDRLA
jgi:hypothetical protein